MKRRYDIILLACVMCAALLCACGEGAQAEKEQEAVQKTAEAESESTAVDGDGIVFTAQDLEGNTVTESVFTETKLTMVNVWATYCNPCLREMPGLGELAGEYEADTFRIIGIVSDVQEGADLEMAVYAATLVEQTGASYPHLLLNESLYNAMLGDVSAVPTTFFVNEKGEVLDTVVGSMDKESWKEKIDALLEE